MIIELATYVMRDLVAVTSLMGWVGVGVGWGVVTSIELAICAKKKYKPLLAGTQIIARAWRSLKNDWWPQRVNATSQVGGHTLMSDDIKLMVYQWVWRQSLGPATPLRLLEELKRLSKH